MADGRHLGFVKVRNFNGQWSGDGQSFVAIGQTVTEISQFFDFTDDDHPLSSILKTLESRILMADRVGMVKYIAMPNLGEISQTDPMLRMIYIFFNMAAARHLGFVVLVWTTHKEHLVVFIVVQNLVGIDAVVSIICMFSDFENAYPRPQNKGFGDMTPKLGDISTKPQGTCLGGKTS